MSREKLKQKQEKKKSKIEQLKKYSSSSSLPITISENETERIEELVDIIYDLLDRDYKKIPELFSTLHPATSASCLQFLTSHAREEVIGALGNKFDPEILSYLDDSVRDTVIDLWAVHEIAQKVEKLEGQDALKILEDLEKEERRALLRTLNPEIRVFLEEGLAYPEDSAGRLMEHQVVAIPYEWNVEKIRTFMSTAKNLPKDLDDIIVVNKARKPIAKIPVSLLVTASGDTLVKDICQDLEIIFSASEDEKNIIYAFKTYSMKSAPVVDKNDKLIGILSSTDIIDLVYDQAQEEMLHSGGLDESDFYSNLLQTSKARLKWLSFSIFGSVSVGMLIDSFRSVIAKNTILVPLLTIIMNISSVASIQVVTIIIRALMNRELSSINIKRTILKELLVALINGLVLGTLCSIIFGMKTFDYRFAILITSSITISMLCSAFSGTFLPMVFNKFGIDPALSSGTFLSFIMDAFSSFSFLIIARYLFG